DVHAVLPQRRPDRRRGIRSPGRNLELDESNDLLRHYACLPSTPLLLRSRPDRPPISAPPLSGPPPPGVGSPLTALGRHPFVKGPPPPGVGLAMNVGANIPSTA